MGKYFSSGLVILLPIVVTCFIVNFAVNFLTRPFLELTKELLQDWILFPAPALLFHSETFVRWSSKLLILATLSGCVMLIGLVANLFLVKMIFRFGDRLLHNLPIINTIYQACQDVVFSLFSSTSKKFSLVVLVPFPNPQSFSLGLVTNQRVVLDKSNEESEHLISVFIPGTPNPSVGYMLMFKQEQLLFVNMTVEQAMKFIISCGIVA
ncbi:MAG: DUF502 domain-containing protein [Parachlamydiaceae bacterium]